jgi:hypothetical protein
MKFILTAVLAMVLVAGQVRAQCASADSVFGAAKDLKKPKTRYDQMTDSTEVNDMYLQETPFNGDGGKAQFSSFFGGKTLKDSSMNVVQVTITQMLVKTSSLRGGKNGYTADDRHFADVSEVLFLMDDSVRFRVPVINNTFKTTDHQILGSAELEETMTAKLTPADLLRIAKAQKGTMRVKDYNFGIGSKQTNNLKNAVRFLMCGGQE